LRPSNVDDAQFIHMNRTKCPSPSYIYISKRGSPWANSLIKTAPFISNSPSPSKQGMYRKLRKLLSKNFIPNKGRSIDQSLQALSDSMELLSSGNFDLHGALEDALTSPLKPLGLSAKMKTHRDDIQAFSHMLYAAVLQSLPSSSLR
jgi:hypothetical protein